MTKANTDLGGTVTIATGANRRIGPGRRTIYAIGQHGAGTIVLRLAARE